MSTVPWDLDPRLHPLPQDASPRAQPQQPGTEAEAEAEAEGAGAAPTSAAPHSFLDVLDSASQGLAAAALPSPDLLEALGRLPAHMRGRSLVQSFGQMSQDFTTQAQALVLASQMEQHLALLAQVATWTESDDSVRGRNFPWRPALAVN